MDRNLQTYFTTGEFAKFCGVNKKTLFHYDDIGVFRPNITDDKGYRYYSYHQLDVFYIIAVLKEMNVPLKEIKTYLEGRTPEWLLNLSEQKIKDIDSEIEKLYKIRHSLEETIVYTNKGLHADFEKITVEEQEEEIIIRSELLSEENTKDTISRTLTFKNFENNTLSKDTSFVGAMLSREDVLSGNYYDKYYLFVKTTNRNTSSHSSTLIKPKGLYAAAYHYGRYETILEAYTRLLAYVQENNLKMGEFVYEEYLIDEVSAESEADYVTQITVQIV
jgi:DNA-binding transcriptional MerR regulator